MAGTALTNPLTTSVSGMVSTAISLDKTDKFDDVGRDGVIKVNAQNGTLVMNPSTCEFELRPHNKEDYLRNTCRAEFNPSPNPTPFWDAFLSDTVAGKALEADKLKRQILSLIVEAATNGALNSRKAFLLYGGTASGKSVLIDLIRATLGSENTSSIDLGNFAVRFALAPMAQRGVLANLSSEMGAKEASARVFKALSSGDEVMVDVKFSNPIHYCNRATLIFAGNQLPRLTDHSDASKERLTILPLVNTKAKELRNRSLYLMLLEEMDDIFSQAVLQYQEEYKRDKCTSIFENEGKAAELSDRWQEESDSVMSWQNENISESETPTTSKALYFDYGLWCKSAGVKYPV
ncbi:MAG: hypothetical protein KAG92_04600, partial [Deltaproteobacteria bacterium]|nr:hypothetical protein [Deltaproteobacteria bacterium]